MIDWERARRRLEEAGRALEAASNADADKMEESLRRRAERLARRRSEEVSPAEAFLIFRLGQERYGLGLNVLREVLSPARWTPLPGAPEGLLGVMNFRGEIRPVWDLARLLGISREAAPQQPSEAALSRPDTLLLAAKNGREAGLLVDRAEEMRDISPEELGLPEPGSRGFLKGRTKDRVLLLDPDAIFGRLFLEDEKRSQ